MARHPSLGGAEFDSRPAHRTFPRRKIPTVNRWISTTIPGTPPSVNEIPLSTRDPRYRRARNQWSQDFAHAMSEKGNVLPRRLARACCSAILTFTTHRRRDEGNYRSHIEKWVGDTLQATGRLRDDTPDLYAFGAVAFVHGEREGLLLIVDYDVAEVAA